MVTPRYNLEEELEKIVDCDSNFTLTSCGVTRSQTNIPVLLHQNAYPRVEGQFNLLLLSGTSGTTDDVHRGLEVLKSYLRNQKTLPKKFSLSAIPCGNPDGLSRGSPYSNGSGGDPSGPYPPSEENYYGDKNNPETRYLWRWTNFYGPDLVLEVRSGLSVRWESSQPNSRLGEAVGAYPISDDHSLLQAISEGTHSGLSSVPSLLLICPQEQVEEQLVKLWNFFSQESALLRSPARKLLDDRRSRTPLEVARILGSVYGNKLNPVVYTQGVAISGRLRLKQLDPEGPDPTDDIIRLTRGYASLKIDQVFQENSQGANLAGYVWADELSEITKDEQYANQLIEIAETYRPKGPGLVPPPSSEDYRVEDMFFGAAMLGRATKLTGDSSYIDVQARFLLDANVQQKDGLFWHCNNAPYYWGRGNGFAALGYSETIKYMPEDHRDYQVICETHRQHLNSLRKIQTPSGGWRQVLDFSGSYEEMTATCMIGYTMAHGIRTGILDESFISSLASAWSFVNERIDDDGGLVDVCTGTGVQQNLRDYLDRPALCGMDDRGGALALWFSCEMEMFLRQYADTSIA